MDSSIFKQSQFELFPNSSDRTPEAAKSRLSITNLTFSLESFVILAVVIIVGMVVSYGLGVERGKRVFLASATKPAANQSKQVSDKGTAVVAEGTAEAAVTAQKGAVVSPPVPASPASPNLPGNPAIAEKQKLLGIPAPGADQKVVDKGYTIQVASFKQEKFAHQEAQILQKKGYETLVISKGNYSIVCVGKFAQKNKAQLLASDLRKKYKDLLVRSL